MHPIFVPRAIVQAHKLHLLCIACIRKTMPGKPECTDDVEKCIFALRVHLFSDCIQCRGNLEEEHLLIFPMMGAHYFPIRMDLNRKRVSHRAINRYPSLFINMFLKQRKKIWNLDWKICKYFPNKFAKGFHLSLLHCIASCDKCQQINVKSTLDKCKSCI